jgi:hypothetical protein
VEFLEGEACIVENFQQESLWQILPTMNRNDNHLVQGASKLGENQFAGIRNIRSEAES